MSFSEIYQQFISGMQHTGFIEYIAVFAGIASVWFSKKENILVYPVGLVNTIIYIYLSFQYHLPGEASVNFYYTIMSLYGWYMWMRKDQQHKTILHISYSSQQMWLYQILFFLFFYLSIYFALVYLKQNFFDGAIPWADAFASSTAFTGMWLMTRKKVESWYWWIATNIASIPLYFVKGLVFTSVYYLVLLILAISGLMEWKRKANKQIVHKSIA
ncbi:MAG TPA: nicotinamide riboside transporter PnuC [Chitinophagaceae bacterium]|nr:nicotinamide mononucleotide transporter [Chitinophagaceae bacterium]HQU56892.1 nicotinamide riboside transporter PnuC [Chitinophagaceae bacterium]